MTVKHFADRDEIGAAIHATTDSDAPGACIITWSDTTGGSETCDGWISGDVLFAPTNGQAAPGRFITEDGEPDPRAGWYRVQDGAPGLVVSGVVGVME